MQTSEGGAAGSAAGRKSASSSPSPGPSAAADVPTATESVSRPDRGLARGVWEAPAWAFWVVLAAVVAFATLYVLRRAGILARKQKQPSDEKKAGPR